MKLLSLLAPVLNLLKNISFIYRIIGIALGFMFFSSNFKDVLFLSSYSDAQPMTIDMLAELPQDEIPRYIQLENVSLMSDLYVATEDEETGEVLDASYPIYSASQIAASVNGDQSSVEAKVLVKDKAFNAESMLLPAMNIAGMYDNDSFTETKNILEANGINIADDAILLVKGEAPPAMGSSLALALLTGLLSILLVLSFVPGKYLGVVETSEGQVE